MKCSPTPSHRHGFTLLEMVIAFLLVAMLIGMVFATARTSLVLGNTVVTTQNEEMLHQAFFDFLEKRLNTLPGNAELELTTSDSGSHYLSDLVLQDVPVTFNWGGKQRTPKAIRLSTVKRRSGYLDIVLSYFENEIIESSGEETPSASSSSEPEEPFAEITLLEGVAFFEWRVLDGRSLDYQYEWTLSGRLPLQLELVCSFGASGNQIRHVFWIPPRQNPEIFMRELLQGAQNPAPNNGPISPEDEERLENLPDRPVQPPEVNFDPNNP